MHGVLPMKRVALYMRVSSLDQRPETQLYDLQQLASQRGYQTVKEYEDRVRSVKARRPALEDLLADARRHRFDVVVTSSLTQMARSIRHVLKVIDELNRLGIGFISCRENIDTSGSLAREMAAMVSGLSELHRDLTIENVREGMRRARLDGVRIGRKPLDVDRAGLIQDRLSGMSLTVVGKKHGVSRGTVCRLVKLAGGQPEKLSPYTGEPLSLGASA